MINQNKMKQTAVEWLVKEFSEILGPLKTKSMQDLLIVDSIKKAKAMEKEQIKKVWQESRKIKSQCNNWNCTGDEKLHESFEQYYNETFKSE